MPKIINGHNKKITLKTRDQIPKRNCREKVERPLEGKCQINDVVYKCDVRRSLPKKVRLGLAEGKWKSCFYNSKLSFKHNSLSNKTTLSSYIWYLIDCK